MIEGGWRGQASLEKGVRRCLAETVILGDVSEPLEGFKQKCDITQFLKDQFCVLGRRRRRESKSKSAMGKQLGASPQEIMVVRVKAVALEMEKNGRLEAYFRG